MNLNTIRNFANKIYPVTIKKTLVHYIQSNLEIDTILLINNPIGIILAQYETVLVQAEIFKNGKKIAVVEKELSTFGSWHLSIASLNLGEIENGVVILNFFLSKEQQRNLPNIHFYYYVAYYNKKLNCYSFVHTMDGLQFRLGRPWWWPTKSSTQNLASKALVYSSRLIPMENLESLKIAVPNATKKENEIEIQLDIFNEKTKSSEKNICRQFKISAQAANSVELLNEIPRNYFKGDYSVAIAAKGAPTQNQYPYIFSKHAGGNFAVHHI